MFQAHSSVDMGKMSHEYSGDPGVAGRRAARVGFVWAVAVAAVCFVCYCAPAVRATCVQATCNGHGMCELGGGGKDVCICYDGWTGSDCNRRLCPTGNAWVGDSDASGNSHFANTVCSNKGICNNATGTCDCFPGYTGVACQRWICPSDDSGTICSGHGRCISMRDAALRRNETRGATHETAYSYGAWDADMIFGCECDEGFMGYRCEERKCPTGDDPLSTGTYEVQSIQTTAEHQDEVQTFTTSLSAGDSSETQEFYVRDALNGETPLGGAIRLRFVTTQLTCHLCAVEADQTTELIDVPATTADIKAKLEALSNIDEVDVSRSADAGFDSGYTYTVTFVGDGVGGDVPLLQLIYNTGDAQLYGDSPTIGYGTITNGNQVSGTITLSYDDRDSAGNIPAGAYGGSVTSSAINPYDTASEIATKVAAMANIGTVTVTKTVARPAFSFTVTFTSNLGNMAQVTCDDSAFTDTCTAATAQDGNYIEGDFTLTFEGATTGSLDWNAADADIANALTGLYAWIGQVDVTSSAYYPTGLAAEDVGAYQWTVTFRQLTQDAGDITITESITDACAVSCPATTATAAIGTEASRILGTETDEVDAQVSEVQIIECTCDSCSGGVQLSFRNKRTSLIAYNADDTTVEAALEALETIDGVRVTMHGGSELCDSDGVSTAITFTHVPGDVPPIEVDVNTMPSGHLIYVEDRDYTLALQGQPSDAPRAKVGTREDVECGNRGVCDRSIGECVCFDGYADSNGQWSDDTGTIVGASSGLRRNCGFASGITSCPAPSYAPNYPCNDRGTCSNSPQYLCTCNSGYSGGACEKTDCPTGTAWFDYATATDTAHASATCSARGTCLDEHGVCTCDTLFSMDSTACSKQDCKESDCAEKGTCYSMADLAPLSLNDDGDLVGGTYSGWDASKLYGCRCNANQYFGIQGGNVGNYTDPVCGERLCLTGDDPLTDDQDDEVQTITCVGTGAISGDFTVKFRTFTTEAISGTAAAADVEAALELLPSIRNVTVTFDSSNTAVCKSGGTTVTSITFNSEHGDLPDITVTDSVTNGALTQGTTTTGTKEEVECSARGVCNGRTGRCHCAPCYGPSDRSGNPGQYNDCGHKHCSYAGGDVPINFVTYGLSPANAGLGI